MHLDDLDFLRRRAAAYFDRPSFSMPVFVGPSEVAMLDDRSGVPQLSLLDADSLNITPVTSYPERLLSLLGTLSGRVVFGMDVGGNERQQIWTLTLDSTDPRRVTQVPGAIHEPGALAYDGGKVVVKSNARDESTFDIVCIDLATSEIDHWLDNAGTATPVATSRDGHRALVIKSNTNLDADLILIDREANTITNITAHDGEAWILGAAFDTDVRNVWFITNEGREFTRLERMDLESGTRSVVIEDERDIESFRLSPTGSHVIVAVNEGGASRIAIHNLASDAEPVHIQGLGNGTVDRFAWSPDGTCVAFGHSTAESPSRIVFATLDGSIQVLSGETDASRRPSTAEPQPVTYTSFDGLDIPGFLFKPAGEGPFPVLVEVHGGPASQRRLQYTPAVPTIQFIQSLGIAVLSLNVREAPDLANATVIWTTGSCGLTR